MIKLWLIRLLLRTRKNENNDDIEGSRQRLDKLGLGYKLPSTLSVSSVNLNGINSDLIVNKQQEADRTIIYFHGGGFITGSSRSHREIAARLAMHAKANVYLPNYRKAPEHTFPVSHNDAFESYKYLIEKEKLNPATLLVAGDSAGGNLTACVIQRAIKEAIALPACCAMISPWGDLRCLGASLYSRAHMDPMLNKKRAFYFRETYKPEGDYGDPICSPVNASFEGFPKTLIQVGSDEIVYDDAFKFEKGLLEVGADVRLDVWPDMFHVWHITARWLPQARHAIEQIAEFYLEALSESN